MGRVERPHSPDCRRWAVGSSQPNDISRKGINDPTLEIGQVHSRKEADNRAEIRSLAACNLFYVADP